MIFVKVSVSNWFALKSPTKNNPEAKNRFEGKSPSRIEVLPASICTGTKQTKIRLIVVYDEMSILYRTIK